jgi:hypothetical protein
VYAFQSTLGRQPKAQLKCKQGRPCQEQRHALASQLATGPLQKCGWQETGEMHISGSPTERHYYIDETHDGDQPDSDITNLFDKAFCCAIGPRRDEPAVNPVDIEDTTYCLYKVE